jgi:hypothetical protein
MVATLTIDHPAPECFVCGPREDGLGICPGVLDGTEVWARVWVPDRSVSSDGIHVDPQVVWGWSTSPTADECRETVRGGSEVGDDLIQLECC